MWPLRPHRSLKSGWKGLFCPVKKLRFQILSYLLALASTNFRGLALVWLTFFLVSNSKAKFLVKDYKIQHTNKDKM